MEHFSDTQFKMWLFLHILSLLEARAAFEGYISEWNLIDIHNSYFQICNLEFHD